MQRQRDECKSEATHRAVSSGLVVHIMSRYNTHAISHMQSLDEYLTKGKQICS